MMMKKIQLMFGLVWMWLVCEQDFFLIWMDNMAKTSEFSVFIFAFSSLPQLLHDDDNDNGSSNGKHHHTYCIFLVGNKVSFIVSLRFLEMNQKKIWKIETFEIECQRLFLLFSSIQCSFELKQFFWILSIEKKNVRKPYPIKTKPNKDYP